MRLLVKANPNKADIRLGIGGGRASVGLRRLMPDIDMARSKAMGVAGVSDVWHVTADIDPAMNVWDACHAVLRNGLGVAAGDAVTMAEPDFDQHWLPVEENNLGIGGGRDADCKHADPQSDNYPKGPADGWFAGADFSGLADARKAIGDDPPRIRIAHLDTGYDPDHNTKPAGLRADLARNFADPQPDGQPGHDAFDRKTAAINPMFGHGTATLALLAGEPYGGARAFEVVPVRVANWVVLFGNSAIAQALDYVHSLSHDPATRCDVISMSMGGLASAAWADAVNALYDAGIVLVTAAGNNYGNAPVRSIVYPARFNRVLAACGVMANGRPYADLAPTLMAGCYGPQRKMRTALSAFTPNSPWARFGCPAIVDQDGGGTSAATPQIAAAAALWLHKNSEALRGLSGWQRVEAVRRALFEAAGAPDAPPDEHLGRGLLRAARCLRVVPAVPATLRREAGDDTNFDILKLLTGLGIAEYPAGNRMLELEALQLSQRSGAVEQALRGYDPSDPRLTDSDRRSVLKALAEVPECSETLRTLVTRRLGVVQVGAGGPPPAPPPAPTPPQEVRPLPAQPRRTSRPPPARRLRVFAIDPGAGSVMATRRIATATLQVDWESELAPGPIGEYLEVVDVDPASDRAYAPVNLNLPELLAQDGLTPSEGSPQFHQQMVYAVAMKTIRHFRVALGRVPFWADHKPILPDGHMSHRFVRRLRIYPHGLREPNAYYSPARCALLFGYFRADNPGAIDVRRGGMVFTCLSHDIVAHETTHALLDGLHPRWKEPGHPDTPAFHEAFADLVALFQHFTMPSVLLTAIEQARGTLQFAQSLGELAKQFGQATGEHGALRNAVGKPGNAGDYLDASEKGPHALGEVLVAAIFDAWLQVYQERTAPLLRLATGGSGVLSPGDISQDLAQHLAEEAATLAGHFLNICIRALDYCPPVEPTFGEYLRAMITADRDMVEEDRFGYRVALADGFRKRGILPEGVQTWSPDALVWETPVGNLDTLNSILTNMAPAGGWRLDSPRLDAWGASRKDAGALHKALMAAPDRDALLDTLGLHPPPTDKGHWVAATIDGVAGEVSRIEVHSVRPGRRVGPDGEVVSSVVIEITQRWKPLNTDDMFRGGCTIIWDRTTRTACYVIRKRVGRANRTLAQQQYRLQATGGDRARANYFRPDQNGSEPFALMHSDR